MLYLRRAHYSPSFSISSVTIMDMGLTWLQVQYHMKNSGSPWDIFSTSLPQDPQKRLEMLFANLKEAMNSIAFSVSLEDPLLSLIQ